MMELEELPLEQYRARDELPLVQQWARGRADDRVTLSADLEKMDLLTTAGTGGDHSSVPALLRTHTSGKGVRVHDVRQSPLSARILLALPP